MHYANVPGAIVVVLVVVDVVVVVDVEVVVVDVDVDVLVVVVVVVEVDVLIVVEVVVATYLHTAVLAIVSWRVVPRQACTRIHSVHIKQSSAVCVVSALIEALRHYMLGKHGI